MKINKHQLLLLASLVWGAAGFNILRIGIIAYRGNVSLLRLLLSLVVFTVFQVMVFGKLVRRHSLRINQYREEKQFFLKFFDGKSFAVMAFMMSFGIGLRVSGICPDSWIAVFYTGLGASLFLAGILFGLNYIKACTDVRLSRSKSSGSDPNDTGCMWF